MEQQFDTVCRDNESRTLLRLCLTSDTHTSLLGARYAFSAFSLIFHISDTLPSPTILGLERPLNVRNLSSITCHANYYRAHNVTLTWYMDRKEMPAQLLTITTNNSMMASYSSRLLRNFTRHEDNQTIECIATAVDGLYMKSTAKVIRLHCTYYVVLF